MKTYRIALYPGDGIGTEVLPAAKLIMEAAAARTFELEFTEIPWGCEYCDRTGSMAPKNFLEILRPFDAIFLGALGDPRRYEDALTLRPLVQIRQSFQQYACVRPNRRWRGAPSPLAGNPSIDLLIIRENSEGEYVPCGGRHAQGADDEVAIQTAIHTRKGIRRILKFAFASARQRRGHLTLITKSNALTFGMKLWDEVFEDLKLEYPSITTERMNADAAALEMVRRPHLFDVVAASNLFGDILSDLAAAVSGGLGLAASANLNPERTFPSLFEPVHGSAPDIAGTGIANPAAAIASGAMMLDWLGEPTAAQRITDALEYTIVEKHVTPDLGGVLNTEQMTEAVLAALEQPFQP